MNVYMYFVVTVSDYSCSSLCVCVHMCIILVISLHSYAIMVLHNRKQVSKYIMKFLFYYLSCLCFCFVLLEEGKKRCGKKDFF